jgi:hypothetical protein
LDRTNLTLVDDRSVWTATDIGTDHPSWLFRLSPNDLDQFRSAVNQVVERGLRLEQIRRDDFYVPEFQPTIEAIRAELERGRGFVQIRGLPVHSEFTEAETSIIYWGIGQHLGTPVPQNDRGHLLGHIVDKRESGESIDPHRRPYEGRGAFRFHNDQSDVVGLLCFRRARSGGESTIASATAVHNAMLRERPDLLEALYGTFYFDRKKEEIPGALPYYKSEIFSAVGGSMSVRWSTSLVYDAQRFDEVPRMTKRQLEALSYLDEVPNRDGMHIEMQLEEGDMQFLNNYVVVHGRREYEDFDEPHLRRHMLRLWLALHEGRHLSPTFEARRGGIPQRATAGH